MILNLPAVFGDAHYADRIQLPGEDPMVVATEPQSCPDGGLTCICINHTGAPVPVCELPSTPMTLLARPRGAR